MDEDPVTKALRIAARLQRAGQAAEQWPEALAELRDYMACHEVFGLADVPASLAGQARRCAEGATGRCGAGPKPDEAKRLTCLAMCDLLDLALADDGQGGPAVRRAAEHALDEVERAVAVCDQDLRLIHANRAMREHLVLGRWLVRRDRHLAMVPEARTPALSAALAGLNGDGGEHLLPIHFAYHDGRRAELRARRLRRQDDGPDLFLLRLGEFSRGELAPPAEPVETVRRRTRGGPDGMTPRQRQLAEWLLAGCGVSEAARRMGIARATASEHMKGLFRLSHTARQADLLVWLRQVRLD